MPSEEMPVSPEELPVAPEKVTHVYKKSEWHREDPIPPPCVGDASSALRDAAFENQVEVVDQMIKNGASPTDAWFGACRGGHLELAQRLSITCREYYVYELAVEEAVRGGHLKLVEWFCTPRSRAPGAHYLGKYIRIAAKHGHRLLLGYLCNIYIKGYTSLFNPGMSYAQKFERSWKDAMLIGACEGGHLDLACEAIRHGARDFDAARAASIGRPEIIKLLRNPKFRKSETVRWYF